MTDNIDFNFLAEQSKRILQQVRSMRDELRVNSAMVQRCSNAITDQSETLNAIHHWMIGMNDRVSKLENQP
jgi:hypothetical protein